MLLTNGPNTLISGGRYRPNFAQPRGSTRPPLELGPLDFVLSGNDVFTNFSQVFDLAAPDAVLYFACNYSGDPEISISHGGQELTIVRQEREPGKGLLSLVAAGRGLTVEAAPMAISATGGQLNGGAGRIVEMSGIQPGLSGWTAGAHGDNPPAPFLVTGSNGGTVKVCFVNGGADRSHSSRVEGADTKFSGYTIAGEPYPYDISPANPEWVLGDGWTVDGDAFVHTGPTESICSLIVPDPFSTRNGRRAFIEGLSPKAHGWIAQTGSAGSTVGLLGEKSGYVVGGSIGSVDRLIIGGSGNVRISQVQWLVESQGVTWVFATAPAVNGQVLTPIQAYRPSWSAVAVEILGQEI